MSDSDSQFDFEGRKGIRGEYYTFERANKVGFDR